MGRNSITLSETSRGVSRAVDLRGVGRAFAILERLGDGPLRASEIARSLNLKWTTTHRVLSYLTEMGYLDREETTRRYTLGVRSYSLGSSYIARLGLPEISQPYLEAGSAMGRATAQLVKRDHRRSVVLSVVKPQRGRVPETTVGCNFPLHCGSKGHVLLAYADSAFVDDYLSRPLQSLTPKTIVDPDTLRTRFDQIRERGWAVTDRDVRHFSSSVAAPILARDGEVAASMTLVVKPIQLRHSQAQLVDVVVRAAQGVSGLLARTSTPLPPP